MTRARCTVLRAEPTPPRPGFCHGWRLILPACERHSAAAEPPITVGCSRTCAERDAVRDQPRGARAVAGWDW
jgi:hypothetical protein